MQNNSLKKYRSLLLLVFFFLLPLVAAYFIFSKPFILRKLSTTNYGQWAPEVKWQLHKEKVRPWQLVLWNDGACEQVCMQKLDQLARIRLAMGRKLYELDLVLVIPEGIVVSDAKRLQLKDNNIHYQFLPREEVSLWQKDFLKQPIVLFTPEHQAILMYPTAFESKKMFHDLQVLIK